MTRVVLLRHGAHAEPERCAGRRHDPPLSAEGLEQAVRARQRLGPAAHVVTSPLRRARQTAAAWTDAPAVDARLAERDFGDWEGRAWAQLWAGVDEAVTADERAYAAFTPPGGEPLVAVADRAAAALTEAAGRDAGTVLLVVHGGTLRLGIARVLGIDDHRAFRLGAPHGAAAVLCHADGVWTLEALGV